MKPKNNLVQLVARAGTKFRLKLFQLWIKCAEESNDACNGYSIHNLRLAQEECELAMGEAWQVYKEEVNGFFENS